MADSLEQALELWRRGLNVISVPRPDETHDGKKPIVPWGEYQSRRQTESDVRRSFNPGVASNIAIITGAISGIVAIDADSRRAMEAAVLRLPYTPWQTLTGKGYHLFYRHPGIPVRNRVGISVGGERLEIDVRGDGGFVIAPGSIHATGVTYVAAGDWTAPREELPYFWPGWVATPSRHRSAPTRVTGPKPTGDVVERARMYLAAIPRPNIGAGSDAATFSAACRLVRGFDLSADVVESLLWEWAGDRAGWTEEWIAEKVQHALRYGTEPIGEFL